MISKAVVKNWHSLDWEEAVGKLKSDVKQGLTDEEAESRQRKFGRNVLPQEKPLSKFKILLDQFKSPLIYILLIAGIVVLFFRDYTDAIVIFGAVFLNTIVGYIQEIKASNALKELKKMVRLKAKVLRQDNVKLVDFSELIPGDIIILAPGDKVPADARLIEVYELKVNEMTLSGEWLPAEKKTEKLPEKTPLADRDNMVYMGTAVEYGKAKAIVVSTSIDTEIGQIAEMLKETKEEKTPLQKKISHFSAIIGLIIALICIFIFIEGILTGGSFLEMFTVSVAVAVAAIPEGLPVAMTVILALGMQRILKRKGLTRKLLAAETLGSTSIIATDKTLTLTEGKMKVSEILVGNNILNNRPGNPSLALKIATMANEAFIENPEDSMEKWVVQGRPTDKALLLAGVEAGINRKELEKKMLPLAEIPFDSGNKYLARAFQITRKRDIVYVAGAPEKLLEMSRCLKVGRKQKPLNSITEEKVKARIEEMAKRGLRVVAVGYKEIEDMKNLLKDLVFVGLIGLNDPVRKGVKKAIKICRQAGMKPIIITGDHKLTAKTVAEEIGFKIKEKNIMEGSELDELSDEQFRDVLKDIEIYSRVEPRHKMRIIQAWQDKAEVVAMTGDGINDAPALKKADIGVGLGSGTEVAKEVSDLVLLTDDFNVIVSAVEEGRAIIDNIRKVITYLLSDSFTETILVGASIFFGFPLPVSAVQILWVNLIEDGLPDIALSFEPKEKDLMKQKPQSKKIPLLTKEMKVIIFIIGIIGDLILLGIFFYLWKKNYDIAYIRTMVFCALAINSLFYVFSCKSLRRNIWHINIFSNRFLLFSWIFGIAMLLGAVYFPPFQTLLKTVALDAWDWLIIAGLGVTQLVMIEATKWFFIARHQTNI